MMTKLTTKCKTYLWTTGDPVLEATNYNTVKGHCRVRGHKCGEIKEEYYGITQQNEEVSPDSSQKESYKLYLWEGEGRGRVHEPQLWRNVGPFQILNIPVPILISHFFLDTVSIVLPSECACCCTFDSWPCWEQHIGLKSGNVMLRLM